jgi:hypothetical protein
MREEASALMSVFLICLWCAKLQAIAYGGCEYSDVCRVNLVMVH